MKGIQVLDRPASQSFYAVAGRFLFVESLERDLAPLIDRLFAGWQLTPVSSPERLPDIRITFSGCATLPSVPAGLNEFEVAAGGHCYVSDDGHYLKFARSLLHLQNDGHVSVEVLATDITNVELARVTSFAVCAALRRFGLFELHSGGVVLPDSEAGVLIIGPSGSGKSTLTLQLVSAGWSYLSDDEVLLSAGDGQVEARGFRGFFALADGPTSAFKNCFEPEGTRIEQAVPRFLLFTTITGESHTQLHELSQAETMARLIRACPWATYDTAVAGPNLELLSKLARQAKGFDLSAGTDLLEPGAASRFLSVSLWLTIAGKENHRDTETQRRTESQ